MSYRIVFRDISYAISHRIILKSANTNNFYQCCRNQIISQYKSQNAYASNVHRYYCAQPKFVQMMVDYDDVKKAIVNRKTLIIDVRENNEVKENGKIPNSINIPVGHVATALGAVSETEFEKIYKRPKPTKETEIIFYCEIGKRSGIAQQNALNLGYKKTMEVQSVHQAYITLGTPRQIAESVDMVQPELVPIADVPECMRHLELQLVYRPGEDMFEYMVQMPRPAPAAPATDSVWQKWLQERVDYGEPW